MIYGSVCSGVEAATVAWHPLGWVPAWFCEFDKFPSQVLAHHYPDVPNLHDMTEIEQRTEYNDRPIDLLVGGTPCQSFSIAGLRKGLGDARGNLALKFCQILRDKQPRWFVWENVPGVLSSNKGRDFASILSGFQECGYGIAYRILDAQYFGVAQRRRRVFVIGHLGDWRPAAAVLFEPKSVFGYPAPSREQRKDVAPTLSARTKGGGGLGTDFDLDGGFIPAPLLTGRPQGDRGAGDHGFLVAGTIDASSGRTRGAGINPAMIVDVAHTLRAEGFDASEDGTGRGIPLIPVSVFDPNQITSPKNRSQPAPELCHSLPASAKPPIAFSCKDYGNDATEDLCPTLRSMNHDGSHANGCGQMAVAYAFKAGQSAKAGGIGFAEEQTPTLTAGGSAAQSCATIMRSMAVRRLTPRECERLQGFPDDYTLVTYRNKPSADGPRYKAMGNSMAVPVMRWIGERIDFMDKVMRGEE